MLLLNFAHPLTAPQRAQLAALLGAAPDVREIPTQADRTRPIGSVAAELVAAVGLSAVDWQTIPLLINPPGLAPLALAVLAEIHGRCGYFPALVNLRPVAGAVPPQYEVAEIVSLQTLRDTARTRRFPPPS